MIKEASLAALTVAAATLIMPTPETGDSVAAVSMSSGTRSASSASSLPDSCFTATDDTIEALNDRTDADIADGVKGTQWVTPSSVTDVSEFNRTFRRDNLRLHTLGNTSSNISGADSATSTTCKYTRWYQSSADNKIQAFRLFEGEVSRLPNNISARVEAATTMSGWDGSPPANKRFFWKGRYQIANAAHASLFQLKQASHNDWAVMLRLDPESNIYILPRNGRPTLVGNARGKKFNLRVEDERIGMTTRSAWRMTVELDGQSPVTVAGEPDFSNEPTKSMQFRWGMYQDGGRITMSGGEIQSSFGKENKEPAKNGRVRVAGATWGQVDI